jgi:hypothetical protein
MSADAEYTLELGAEYSRPCGGTPAAQRWCDRGMLWAQGFNHAEGAHCFAQAAVADASCALARWGEAHCLGVNYNSPELDPAVGARALALAEDAVRLLGVGWITYGDALDTEGRISAAVAFIKALPARLGPAGTSREAQDAAYAVAMEEVYVAHGEADADVAFLYADALMQLNPWRLWQGAQEAVLSADFECQTPTDANTTKLVAVLERGLRLAPRHGGLCHLYVHALEMGPRSLLRGAQLAGARDTIRGGCIPDSGHLVHMASHIDVQLGEYATTIKCNLEAVAADLRFKARRGVMARRAGVSTSAAGPAMYDVYCAHNYHFVVYGAMFSGQYAVAKLTALELVSQIGQPDLATSPMLDYLEMFLAVPLHVMVRFGRWHDILADPLPPGAGDTGVGTDATFAATLAVQRYARTVALAALERVAEAEAEAELFEAARAQVPAGRKHLIYNSYADVLCVAAAMLRGEIAYRKGDHEAGFAKLREAVALDAALSYEEPWSWMQPPRHALGALLLEQGEVEEAAAVYTADLAAHPGGNIWALHGLTECEERGAELHLPAPPIESEADSGRGLAERLAAAQAGADIAVGASCFCRLSRAAGGGCCGAEAAGEGSPPKRSRDSSL